MSVHLKWLRLTAFYFMALMVCEWASAQYDRQPLFVDMVSSEGKVVSQVMAERRRAVYPMWKGVFPFADYHIEKDTLICRGFLADTSLDREQSYRLIGPYVEFTGGQQIILIGAYDERGGRTGYWAQLSVLGDTLRRMQYEANEILSNRCYRPNGSLIHESIDCGESEPYPLNMVDVKRELAYPSAQRKQGNQGKVLVGFTVDREGRVDMKSVFVLRMPHRDFYEEVRRVLPLLRFKPAMKHGEPVPARTIVTFNFQL